MSEEEFIKNPCKERISEVAGGIKMKKFLYHKLVRNTIRFIFVTGISMFPFVLTGILYQITGVV